MVCPFGAAAELLIFVLPFLEKNSYHSFSMSPLKTHQQLTLVHSLFVLSSQAEYVLLKLENEKKVNGGQMKSDLLPKSLYSQNA